MAAKRGWCSGPEVTGPNMAAKRGWCSGREVTGSNMAARRGWCSGPEGVPSHANEFTNHRDQLIKGQQGSNYRQSSARESSSGTEQGSNFSRKVNGSGTWGDHIKHMFTSSPGEGRPLAPCQGHRCDGSGESNHDPTKVIVDALEKWEYPLLTEMSKNVREIQVSLITSQVALADKHNKQEEALMIIQDQLSELLETHVKPQIEPETEIKQHRSAPLTSLSQPTSRKALPNSASQTNTLNYAAPEDLLFGPDYKIPKYIPVTQTTISNTELQERYGCSSRSSQTMQSLQIEKMHQTIPPKTAHKKRKQRSASVKSVTFPDSKKGESIPGSPKSQNNSASLKSLNNAVSLKSQNNSATLSLSSQPNPASPRSLANSAPRRISFKTASQRSPPKPVSQKSLSQNSSQRSISKKKKPSEPESQQSLTKPASQSVSQPPKQKSLPKSRSQSPTKPASKRALSECASNKSKPKHKELTSELKAKYSLPSSEHDFDLVNRKLQHLEQIFKENNVKKYTNVGEQLPPLPPVRLPVTRKPNDILPRRETNHNIEQWLMSQRNEYLLERLSMKFI